MTSIVYATRKRDFEGTYHKIETPPLSLCTNNDRAFYQFGFTLPNKDNTYNRTLAWGHPDLISICRDTASDMYIDATWDAAPHGFKQCVIIMVFDTRTSLYTPAWWALTQDKSTETYETILFHCLQKTGHTLAINTLTSDFEPAFAAAARRIFGADIVVIGCLFHLKEAWRRYMEKLKMKNESVEYALKVGLLDLLTVIPINEIVTKGIPYLRSKLDKRHGGSVELWDLFWVYFQKTWIKKFKPALWNVHHLLKKGVSMRNRTNNPLERYNRTMKTLFPVPHPSVEQFVEVIKKEADRFLEEGRDILLGHQARPKRLNVVSKELPKEYLDFVVPDDRGASEDSEEERDSDSESESAVVVPMAAGFGGAGSRTIVRAQQTRRVINSIHSDGSSDSEPKTDEQHSESENEIVHLQKRPRVEHILGRSGSGLVRGDKVNVLGRNSSQQPRGDDSDEERRPVHGRGRPRRKGGRAAADGGETQDIVPVSNNDGGDSRGRRSDGTRVAVVRAAAPHQVEQVAVGSGGGGPVGPAVGPVPRRKGKNPFSDRDTKAARRDQAIVRAELTKQGKIERARVLKKYEEGNENYVNYPAVYETDPGEWTGETWVCNRQGRVPKHPDEPRHLILGYRPSKKELKKSYITWRQHLEDWFDYLNLHSKKGLNAGSSDEDQ